MKANEFGIFKNDGNLVVKPNLFYHSTARLFSYE